MTDAQDASGLTTVSRAQPGPARRGVLQGAALGSAMALLAGARPAQAADANPFPHHPRWRFVFVNHVTTNPFFVPTQYGLQDACDLLGCDHQWTGSANSDVAEMVNAMNAAVAAKASAIAVPIIDADGRVRGALTLAFFASATRMSDAVVQFVAPLTATATAIRAEL